MFDWPGKGVHASSATRQVLGSSSSSSRQEVTLKRNQKTSSGDTSRMLLMICSYNVGENATSILHRSCNAANVSLTYDIVDANGSYTCTYTVGNNLTASSTLKHLAKDSSRREAAKVALLRLQKQCYTFVTKMKVLPSCDGKEVAREELDNDNAESCTDPVIPEDNVGSKLLKLMGWTGGGLGKNQQGIHEAISVDGVVGRSRLGLGNSSATGAFHSKIESLLKEHKQAGFPYDLKFSSDFSKDERKDIHLIAQRLKLKGKSYGKDDDRYIVVSEKTSRNDLIKNTLEVGGETEKYRVIPPGGSIKGLQHLL